MSGTLVVYFSRTGRTERIALEIAAASGADIERIEERRGRSGLLGYLRSGREAYRKQLVEIEPPSKRPSDYDLVVLGTPVWAGNVCSPVRAYVAAFKGTFKRVALFCTEGGSGAPRVFGDLAELCGLSAIATLVILEKEIKANSYNDKLAQFIESISRPNET